MNKNRNKSSGNQTSENLKNALNAIATNPQFARAELSEVASYIGELAAEALECQRVSTWLYAVGPMEQISCLDLWDQGTQQHTSGATLDSRDAESYLGALDKETIIVMNDVMSDSRCQELAREYLPAYNITSMLDAPFQFDGKLAGVLCFEHVGSPREWGIEEQQFSMAMASLLSIASERNNRQLAERLRDEEQSRYRQLVEGMPDGVAILQNGVVAFVNERLLEMAGIDNKSEMLGRPVSDFFPFNDKQEIQERQQAIISSGTKLPVKEYVAALSSGQKLPLEVSSRHVTWNGEDAIQSILRDVSHKVKAQQALEKSEAMLAEAEEIAHMGTWRMDLPGSKLTCSKGMHRIFGTNDDDVVELSDYLNKVQADDRVGLEKVIHACVASSHAYEITYRLTSKSSDQIWIEEKGRGIVNAKGELEAVTASCRDITKQRKAELDFIESEKFFQNLVNSFSGGVTYNDTHEQYRFVNELYSEWINLDSKNILGKTIKEIAGKEIYADIKDNIHKALKGEAVTFERHSIYPNGDKRDVQLSYVPDIDKAGVVRGFFSIITDISDLKRTEIALRQSQKMEAVGQLTGGIAHDFNNILTIVMGNLEIAEYDLAEDSPLKSIIQAALRGVERGANLTNKLLGFSRRKSSGDSLLDVNSLIMNLQDLISQSLTASINVSLNLEEGLPSIYVNAGDLEHVLLNLALNAKDAMEETGSLTITTCSVLLDPTNMPAMVVTAENWMDQSNHIIISVRDTGSGLPVELHRRVFEPFFTTKVEGKGTGLGLSMAYGFVQRGGGAIQIDSEADAGTCFNIYLPTAEKKPQVDVSDSVETSAIPRGDECILIVDDETALIRLAEANLKRLGYRTISANSGQDALDILENNSDIDLLFTDIIMPEMNGYELVNTVLDLYPKLKILLASGYDKVRQESDMSKSISDRLKGRLLKKPYNQANLARNIRKALDE